jgi:hypothetical protein
LTVNLVSTFPRGASGKSYIVYCGDRGLELDGTRVPPLDSFVPRLHAGEIVG